MLNVCVVSNGVPYKFLANIGDKLTDVLAKNHFYIPLQCGGKGYCKKCFARLEFGSVSVGDQVFYEDFLICQAVLREDISFVYNIDKGYSVEVFSEKYSTKDDFSIALDLGTTTLSASLIDTNNKEVLARISVLNEQSAFGADVITRIENAKNHLGDMKNVIIAQLNKIIFSFCERYSLGKISTVVVSGNTTMLHLFLGVDPTSMGQFPFTPVFLNAVKKSGVDVGVSCGEVVLIPSISAFIGGDVVSGMVALGLEKKNNCILIDLGTNGEIVINARGKLYATSVATGPAFEGATIECGLGGVKGAINFVVATSNDLRYNSIGEIEPKGICGAGLVDCVAVCLDSGLLEEYGSFADNISPLHNRLKEGKFYLTDKVYVSNKDIRQFQLAKSAIRSGVDFLLEYTDLHYSEIDKIYLSGGFGSYLNIDSALRVGLLEKCLKEKIESIGNSSLWGAESVILDRQKVTYMEKVVKGVNVVELGNNQRFSEMYVENMVF